MTEASIPSPGPSSTSEHASPLAAAAQALRSAAWFSPLLLPLALLQSAIAAAPWLQSEEARSQSLLATLSSDLLMRERFEAGLALTHGLAGAAVLALLFSALWLIVLRWSGVVTWSRLRATALKGSVGTLVALTLGFGGCALLQVFADRAGKVIDLLVAVRATSPRYYSLLLSGEITWALAVGLLMGATLSAAEAGLPWRSRAARLAVAGGLALTGVLALVLLASSVARTHDAGQSLASALGRKPMHAASLRLVVLARDRTWCREVEAGAFLLPHAPDVAADVKRLLARRSGQTLLAQEGEPYLLGERLSALDADGARAVLLEAIHRRAAPRTVHALLLSLSCGSSAPGGSCSFSALLADERLTLGPAALLRAAQGLAREARRDEAEAALARFRGLGGEQLLLTEGGSRSLVLNSDASGHVTGRLMMDGAPWQGRVGLIATEHLFLLPKVGRPCPITWLLRLSSTAPCSPQGSFSFDQVTPGEQALVLIGPPGPPEKASLPQPLPRIALAEPGATLDIGLIDLRMR